MWQRNIITGEYEVDVYDIALQLLYAGRGFTVQHFMQVMAKHTEKERMEKFKEIVTSLKIAT